MPVSLDFWYQLASRYHLDIQAPDGYDWPWDGQGEIANSDICRRISVAIGRMSLFAMAVFPPRQGALPSCSVITTGNLRVAAGLPPPWGVSVMENPMNEQPTVADYIVRRLAREGITDCFGVAGDFAFSSATRSASEAIRWIGCSNELDAAYAADGYARVRGCSMLLTTYAVGELSALNGVMGARAERSCVFHLVGMPTMRHQRVRKIIHHTLGDGEFQNFANISAQAACVSAVITPDNCATKWSG